MVFGLLLSVSWICLLFGSAACYPAAKRGPTSFNAAAGRELGAGPASYANAPAAFGFGAGPASYANAPAAFGLGAGPASYANAPAAFGFGAGPASYANAPAAFGFGDGPVPYGSPSSAGGAHALFYALSSRMPSRPFPDFSAWESNVEAPQSMSETSPLPPSSYIIQSSNGYQRARELLAHTDYSPYYPPPPPLPSKPLDVPSKSAPMTGSKGGKKAYRG
ncbi:fibroin heavy chain-like [Toxotes jaculatrix]|uniref:fibroin heavy chain-like n=1 Tax=Toxotes jaculatrix TaxID=941984 RepID=UPI001B3ADCB0|nr:fibroin heavy chain-like [Toxotes jaculatrix]